MKTSFCGLPEYPLNTHKYNITLQTKSRLFILNSYRKIIMAFLPVKKL